MPQLWQDGASLSYVQCAPLACGRGSDGDYRGGCSALGRGSRHSGHEPKVDDWALAVPERSSFTASEIALAEVILAKSGRGDVSLWLTDTGASTAIAWICLLHTCLSRPSCLLLMAPLYGLALRERFHYLRRGGFFDSWMSSIFLPLRSHLCVAMKR